jgi:hypothetical protein
MKGTEHGIHAAFVQWLGVSPIPGIELAVAAPNGGERNAHVRAKLKVKG